MRATLRALTLSAVMFALGVSSSAAAPTRITDFQLAPGGTGAPMYGYACYYDGTEAVSFRSSGQGRMSIIAIGPLGSRADLLSQYRQISITMTQGLNSWTVRDLGLGAYRGTRVSWSLTFVFTGRAGDVGRVITRRFVVDCRTPSAS